MNIELKYQPSATVAVCNLKAGETLVSEGGALMALNGQVDVQTTTHQKKKGGVVSGLKRLFSGESFFLNKYTASSNSQVWLCASLPGDMFVHNLSGEKLVVTSGSYVACESGVEIDFSWQGFKNIFSGEGLFWIHAHGHGQIILNSFGFIYPVKVDGEYIVDTGHIVAFEESLNFEISKSSAGWIESFMSGEGLVCRFRGQGTVWCQSHNPKSYGDSLTPYLRPRK